MPSLMPDQSTFRASLLDASKPIPDGLIDGAGNSAGRRYDVYRNNVAVSLTEALQTSFPVLRKLIGPQNFDALAGVYLRAHPPLNPLIMHYGAEMSAFLEGFEPLAHIGYLPDVARLEQAMRESYHAADTPPLNPNAFAEIAPEDLPNARLSFAAAVRLIPSNWPLFAIWRYNSEDGAPKPENQAQPVLITRAEFDPIPHPMDPASFACAAQLNQGQPIGTAIETASELDPNFDFTALLTVLLSHNALAAVTL